MPELPEVEVIKRGLAANISGRRVATLQVLEARSFPNYDDAVCEQLENSLVGGLGRRGKVLLIELSSQSGQQLVLMVHLRMTGQLVFRNQESGAATCLPFANATAAAEVSGVPGTAPCPPPAEVSGVPGTAPCPPPAGVAACPSPPADTSSENFSGGFPSASLIGTLPDKSTRVIINFTDSARLYFNDQRKFGYLKLLAADQLANDAFLSQMGPEPLDEGFDWRCLSQCLRLKATRPSARAVKAALLDQSLIAGIGNIYADESLFWARIDPRRPLASLTVPEVKRLCAAIQESLQQSIADGGSTARNYVDALGLRGEFLDLHAAVYGRADQPCPRCGRPIAKIRVAGRGTHYCPRCQK
ncbi:MAG: hypothetical protein FWF71_07635 [Actinomycetia bacterium]|nr:hypothetical protein [Actinomycetes bacterium]